MADISTELQAIEDAIYGKDVRSSIHDAIEKINEEVEYAVEHQLITLDSTLSESGKGADAKATGEAIAAVSGSGMPVGFAEALMNLVDHLAFDDDDPTGQTYIEALQNTLYPPSNLSSISAVYTQSGTVYASDSLDSLKSDLVVTAHYSDSTTATVTAYTLSGTLTVGTSTITVTYGGKTTTFDVTVTDWSITVDVSKLAINKSNTPTSPSYSTSNNGRMSYSDFDILLEGGKTYTFTVTSSVSTAQIGIQAFNQIALNAVNNNNSFDLGNIWESDWLGLPASIYIPTAQNSSPIVGVRFAFRESTSNPTISSNFISAMSIGKASESEPLLYNWDFTESLTDKVAGRTAVLSAGTGYDAPTRTSGGVQFTEATQRIYFNGEDYNLAGKAIEYDVASASFAGNASYHIRHFVISNSDESNGYGMSPLVYRSGTGWSQYGYSSSSGTTRGWGNVWGTLGVDAFSDKTVRIEIGSDGHTVKLYVDGTLIDTQTGCYFDSRGKYLMFGAQTSYDQTKGDQCYNLTLSAVRIYELL